MVDRGLVRSEAIGRPEVMDLSPEGGDFGKKFQINLLASNAGQVWCTFSPFHGLVSEKDSDSASWHFSYKCS